MKPKIFFSHGFRKKEKETAEFFRRILAGEVGEKNILTGEDLDNIGDGDSIDLIKKTLGNIDKCNGVFVVFPKREKIGKNNSYITSTNVIFEVGYATGKNRKIFGFLEDGITTEDIGMNKFMTFLKSKNDQNWKIFHKSELKHRSKEEDLFRDLINGAVKNMEVKREMPYVCLNATKEIIVCNGGYGKIRHSYRHMMKCDKKEGPLLEHFFELGKSAKKGSKIKPFKYMKYQNPHEAYKNNEPFFSIQVIKGNEKSFHIMNPVLKKSDTELHFSVKIDGPLKENQVFEYEYSIGVPDLFPVCSSDLEKGKRAGDLSYVESDFGLVFTEIEELVFIIKFEKGVDTISREPFFRYYYPCNDPKNALPESEEEAFDKRRKGSFYATYLKKDFSIAINGGRLKIYWQPK